MTSKLAYYSHSECTSDISKIKRHFHKQTVPCYIVLNKLLNLGKWAKLIFLRFAGKFSKCLIFGGISS